MRSIFHTKYCAEYMWTIQQVTTKTEFKFIDKNLKFVSSLHFANKIQ